MNSNSKYKMKVVGIASLICLSVTGYFFYSHFGEERADEKDGIMAIPGNGDDIVATVNGRPLYMRQLFPIIRKDVKRYSRYGNRKISEKKMMNMKKEALEEIISNEILYQAGQKLEIKDLERKIARKIEAMKKNNTAWLKTSDSTKIREIAKRNIYVHEYLNRNELISPEISEEKIRRMYENGEKNYRTPETASIRHILVEIKKDRPAEVQKARNKIQEARDAVLSGQPFAEVAKKYSDCNSAKWGGKLGTIRRKYMPPEFETVAFTIRPGKLSGIIRTKFGFHVLEVTERNPGGRVPYKKLRSFFKKFLQKQAARKKIKEHILALRKEARVQIYLR